MIEPVTIDQLRVLVAIVETGSFSAAARQLQRAQSAISQSVATLERQLGVPLFDRGGRRPVLTAEGEALVGDAREVIGRARALRERASAFAAGVEPSLSLAVSLLVPPEILAKVLHGFEARFGETELRVLVQEARGPVESVREGGADLGVTGRYSLRDEDASLARSDVGGVAIAAVVATGHALASRTGGAPVPAEELGAARQLVSVGSTSSSGMRAISRRTWQIADQGLRRSLVVAGFGWAVMPLHTVTADLEAGRLVTLPLDVLGPTPRETLVALRRPDRPPGPASRWLEAALAEAL